MMALPLRIFLFGKDDSPQHFDGVLNPMLILFLPWAFKGKWLSEKRVLFAFALLYFLYAFFLVDIRIRYLLPILPPLVILAVYGIHNIYLRIRRPSVLVALLCLLLALNGLYLRNHFQTVSPLAYLQGKETRTNYLSRMLSEYPAIEYINRNLPRTAKVYFIFTGRRVYYSDREYFHDWSDNPWFLLKVIRESIDGEEVKVKLQNKGITHLLAQDGLLRRFLVNNLTARELKLWEQFRQDHLKSLFGQRGYELFEVIA
jgi:hypothetical protein